MYNSETSRQNVLELSRQKDIKFYLCNSLDQAVIRIRSFMSTWQALKPGISDNCHCNSELASQLLQFTNDAVRDVRNAFEQQQQS